MRVGGLGGGPCKFEESKRKYFSISTAGSPTKPLTRAVETVEKVSFQKLFLKSGREMLKSTWFWVHHTTFWQQFSDF
jgi:hypothetical protein